MGAAPRLTVVGGSDAAPSLEVLMRKVALGDQEAFSRLYDELSASVFGLARRVVRDSTLAEEVAQETFLDVWRLATRFDVQRAGVKTWVMTIAHRRAVDAVRTSEAQRRRDVHAIIEEYSPDVVAEPLIAADDAAEVRRCLDSLTELQAESIRLAYFNGYTYPEVATLLAKPLPTIKTRMRDGLIRLRDCMEASR